MAVTPNLRGKSFPPIRGIPFWDQASVEKVTSLTSSQVRALDTEVRETVAPGIITAFPESPYDPWPEELSIWDTIKLGGIRAPGLARVEGGRGRRVPSMVIPGASGHSAQFLGEDAVQFSIRLTLWTPQQWIWMQWMMSSLLPPPTALIRPVAIKVDYPGLALLNIYDIYIIRVAIPHPDEYQRCHIEINCTEFLPFLNVGASPFSSSTEIITGPDGRTQLQSTPPARSPLLDSIGPNP